MDDRRIISRKEAKALGLQRYFTGVPCSRGMIAHRQTSNWTCMCERCEEARLPAERAWIDRNRESERSRLRAYHKANPEKSRAKSRAWKAANPEAAGNQTRVRRARKLNAIPAWFSELDELAMLESADVAVKRELVTGFGWHIDHMVPLAARQACGLHIAHNLQVIPAAMNQAKGRKMQLTEPGEWVRYG